MSINTWSAIDDYIVASLIPDDPVLEAVLRANAEAGLPAIDVSPAQGRLLHLLVKMSGARRVLEIGRASCREKCQSVCRSRWSPYH